MDHVPVDYDPASTIAAAAALAQQQANAAAAAAAANAAGNGGQQQGAPKKRKSRSHGFRHNAQALTLAGIRNAMHSEEGILQLIQTLKDNGCTMPDQKIAEMLQFIMTHLDIHTGGGRPPSVPKRELCQVLEYTFPTHGGAVYKPGKGFTAVMKSLMRTIGMPDHAINTFAGSKRHYKYVSWTPDAQQKVPMALAWAEKGGAPVVEDDEEKKRALGMAPDDPSRPNAVEVVNAFKAHQKIMPRGLMGRKAFTPKYDVLFSRQTWSYYIRVFMPMCDPNSLQEGIKLDMYKGHISLTGRYSVTPSLPPWTTQGEPLPDMEVVQPLSSSSCGNFSIDIPLPFDVDRSARKEVHVTDIGLIVSLKRLKEEIPAMEFKVHTFGDGSSAPAAPGQALPPGAVPVPVQVPVPGVQVQRR